MRGTILPFNGLPGEYNPAISAAPFCERFMGCRYPDVIRLKADMLKSGANRLNLYAHHIWGIIWT